MNSATMPDAAVMNAIYVILATWVIFGVGAVVFWAIDIRGISAILLMMLVMMTFAALHDVGRVPSQPQIKQYDIGDFICFSTMGQDRDSLYCVKKE